MHQHLREESCEEKFEETPGKAEAGPIMAVFQGIQSITFEVHVTIEVHLIKCLHRDLALAMVPVAVALTMEIEIVLYGAARVLSLFVLSRRDGRCGSPENHQDWNSGKQGKKDCSEQATSDLPSAIPRDNNKKEDQQRVGEAIASGGISG